MATAKKAGGKATPAKETQKAGTPLNAKLKKKLLDDVHIEAETEEEARKALVKLLATNGIENVEGDSLEDLIDMASAFPAGEEESEADGAEGEAEEGEEESGEEEEVEEEEETDEEIAAVSAEVKAKGLSTTGKKTAPAKKETSKAKRGNRAHKLLGRKWEELNDKEKNAALKPLKKFLPEDKFKIGFLQRSIIVKYLGKTNEHNIFKYHLLRLLDDGKLEGIFVSHRFKTPDEFAAYLPPAEEREGLRLNLGESCSYIHPFHIDRVIELFESTDFLKDSVTLAGKTDARMATNHAKLQEQIEGNKDKGGKGAKPAAAAPAKPGAKKTAPPVVEEEEEEVEEEEAEAEEVPAPAPKTAKKVTATAAAPAKPAASKGGTVVASGGTANKAGKTAPAKKK